MYSFRNDYSEGAHEKIMEALVKTNCIQSIGYGCDEYTDHAKALIKKEINSQNAQIHFIPGGTQTNLLVISSFLKPYEAVIAARSGHINVHETGAVEGTGHKVLTVKSPDGKLTPKQILPVINAHNNEHMVKPAMVYISNATELGTIYYKKELEALHAFCKEHNLLLYLDGARLGSALTADGSDMKMQDIAKLTDCFYIGGTKNGALFGEALVLVNESLYSDFRYNIKLRGAMLAKGRLLGLQFQVLFEDGLFYRIADHANKMCQKLKNGIIEEGYSMLVDSISNQIFPVFPNEILEKITPYYDYEINEVVDENHTCIRFVTSWATPQEAVTDFLYLLHKVK